mgnify:CR=1 FL=1
MAKAGRLAADSRAIIARSGLGLSVRAGSKKPDIKTVESFKQALIKVGGFVTFASREAAEPLETENVVGGVLAEACSAPNRPTTSTHEATSFKRTRRPCRIRGE